MTLLNRPTILVFAGPNGSGKSTITESYDCDGIYINADEIKKIRNCSDLEAAQEAEHLREDCIRKHKSFTFETVLSTRRNLELLIRAKQAGYYIKSVFVMTSDVEINVFRVKSRVYAGGHDVPNNKIRSRFLKSLLNLSELAEISDESRVYDNTKIPVIVSFKNEQSQAIYENQYWPESALLQLLDP